MWLACGLDVFSDVARKSLAEVKGKRFPACWSDCVGRSVPVYVLVREERAKSQSPTFWGTNMITILFKIITRIKLLFSNYLGDYSYSFRGSSELINITVTVSLLC